MAAFIIDSTAATPSPSGKENDLNVLLRAAEVIQQADSFPTYPKIATTAAVAGCGIHFTSERPSVSCPRVVSAGAFETSTTPQTYNSPDGLSPKDWCITLSLSETSQQPTVATTSIYEGNKQEDFDALLCKEILPKKAETAPYVAPKKESDKSVKRPRQSSEQEEILPPKRKRKPQAKERKLCSVNDCSNISVNSGVCYRHGATRKLCKVESCTLVALQKGVCLRHGAKHPRCKAEGCTKQAQNGGVCRNHGAKVKLCSSDGCSNKARRGGVCIKHGAMTTRNAKEVYATDMAYRAR